MNMMAALADNSDRIDDDGDVDCEDVELVLRDLLPPLPVVVVDQSPPNKVPYQCSINIFSKKCQLEVIILTCIMLPVVLDVLDKLFKLSRLKVLVIIPFHVNSPQIYECYTQPCLLYMNE